MFGSQGFGLQGIPMSEMNSAGSYGSGVGSHPVRVKRVMRIEVTRIFIVGCFSYCFDISMSLNFLSFSF
jgi:hypothetical protein